MLDEVITQTDELSSSTSSALRDWSYAGMDAASQNQIGFDGSTSLPALAVWLTLTTNPAYNRQGTSAINTEIVNGLAASLGATPACVQYIRDSLTREIKDAGPGLPGVSADDVAAAFQTVSRAFHNMGIDLDFTPEGPNASYMPQNCPTMADLKPVIDAAANSIP